MSEAEAARALPPRWEAVGLTASEYADICRRLGREPGDVELGLFGAMWSEHCSYKSSRAFLGRLPTQAPQVLVGPGENAGVLDLGAGYAVALRVESHNHPSAVEPVQGAATGVGGILRDIFTMGARPVALLDGLCFGPPTAPRARYLAVGVVTGIAQYGNCVGVPTVGGDTLFDPAYGDNPLVNVMCVGTLPRAQLLRGQAPGPGNIVVLIGNRTGRDGIHGASLLASRTFQESPAELRPAVQVGDPFVGKLLLEACLELAAKGLVRGMNDLGAAGITSAAAETAARAGTGIELELERVPCREPGMTPYEILLSESQERMLLVVAPQDLEAVRGVCLRWGLQVAEIGRVTGDGHLRVRMGGAVVAEMAVRHLTREAPRYRRAHRRPDPPQPWTAAAPDLRPQELAAYLLRLLGDPSLAAKDWIYRQYDYQVQADTVLPPGAAGAAVLRHRPTGAGIALTLVMDGQRTALDPYGGAAALVAEAARRVACTGARPLGLTNCLNFANPEDPRVMGQFVAVLDGLAAACRRLAIPVTGGNVSFYNETAGRGIPPTPAIGMLGHLPAAERARRGPFPGPGYSIYLLGQASLARLDGSHYQRLRWGMAAGSPPRPSWPVEVALGRLLAEADFLCSAANVGGGGLLVALAKALLGAPPGTGLEAALPPGRGRLDQRAFGEGPGRVLVTVAPSDAPRLEAAAAAAGIRALPLGMTVAHPAYVLALGRGGQSLQLDRADLRVWAEALPRHLG